MATSKKHDDSDQSLISISNSHLQSRVVEAHIVLLLLCWLLVGSIAVYTCRKLLESHHVLGEGACLIGEHVLNLAKFFVEVTGLTAHLLTFLFIEHGGVVLHDVALEKSNNFLGYLQ